MLYNILPPGIQAVAPLCPEVNVKITLYPQAQEWHSDPLPIERWEPIILKALVQTVTPSTNEIVINTVNSSRQFKLYFTTQLEILSSIQLYPVQFCTAFIYNDTPIDARVIGFKDYRYNGWICLEVSQVTTVHHEHNINHDFFM